MTFAELRSAVMQLKGSSVAPLNHEYNMAMHPRCSRIIWMMGLKWFALRFWAKTFRYLTPKEFWSDRPWPREIENKVLIGAGYLITLSFLTWAAFFILGGK